MPSRTSRALAIGCVVFACLGLSGCGLTPPPVPDAVSSSSPGNEAGNALPARTTEAVAPAGFTDYERAALRVRNVGCGQVSSGPALPSRIMSS